MEKFNLVKEFNFTVSRDYNNQTFLKEITDSLKNSDKFHSLLFDRNIMNNTHALQSGKMYKCKIFKPKVKKGNYVEKADIAKLLIRERAYLIGEEGVVIAYSHFRKLLPTNDYFNSFGEIQNLLLDEKVGQYLPYLEKSLDGDSPNSERYYMGVTLINNRNLNYFNQSHILCFCDIE